MIESLAEHGVEPMDLVPALMTTHTVANPEYDPEEARRRATDSGNEVASYAEDGDNESISDRTLVDQSLSPSTPKPKEVDLPNPGLNSLTASPPSTDTKLRPPTAPGTYQTTARVLEDTSTTAIPGVTTTLSAADENVTLDIRWTVLCDLFLVLIADSVYDARSRVLLENVALKLGLGWIDVVKFESRVTEALEIQEDVETMENEDVIKGRQKAMKKRRYMMLGLATIGESFTQTYLTSITNVSPSFRWRSGHRSISRFAGPCHWCWSRGGFYNHWHHGNIRLPCRCRRHCTHHDRRRPDGIRYCC